ncbi:MAG: DUF389 domain-containing protein [Chitinophagales bacterium]
MPSFIDRFKLRSEKEDYATVLDNIRKGVVFRGTNLWILVFAIFIASLGLNVNSTAVIIGAMLVSPLMGPIMGLGMGMSINDVRLLRLSLYNYLFAAGVGLATSTVYFAISPINDAHSEILARTAPNIYDVLIAFFGGLAGILAMSSTMKGNVIPGVAIATALMPPLCTAGYGLATFNFVYFFGALYLFLINTVFIAFATLITARLLHFPYAQMPDRKTEMQTRRIIYAAVLLTLMPSIYFGYDVVKQNTYSKKASLFIANETQLPNDYLLNSNVDPRKKNIQLTYGGAFIDSTQIATLEKKLDNYGLQNTSLEVRQGFTYLQDNKEQVSEQTQQLSLALTEKDQRIQELQHAQDSLQNMQALGAQVYTELRAQYPKLVRGSVEPGITYSDSSAVAGWICVMEVHDRTRNYDVKKIEAWLQVRLKTNSVQCIVREK